MAGRKGKYETHVLPRLDEIEQWYAFLNEEQIARKLGVSTASFENYKRDFPELRERLKKGREELIEDLKSTLKKKAKGYTYEETKTFIRKENGKEIQTIEKYKKYAHPDTAAIHLLLKNLDDTWRNDDKATMELKQQKVELDRQRMENEQW